MVCPIPAFQFPSYSIAIHLRNPLAVAFPSKYPLLNQSKSVYGSLNFILNFNLTLWTMMDVIFINNSRPTGN